MHILTWNLAQRRALPSLQAIRVAYRPQLLMLQEAARPTDWAGAAVGCAVPGKTCGSWLLATEGTLASLAVPGYDGWLTGATWSIGERRIACFSLHAPSGTGHSYVAECRRMVGLIDQIVSRDMPLIIGGDFNFRSFGKRAEGEEPANTKEESEALDEFAALGFSVAWRSANPSGPMPQTLRWSGNQATPYHCDGFLVRNLIISSCDVLSTESLGFPSDHEPVLLQLAPTAAGSV